MPSRSEKTEAERLAQDEGLPTAPSIGPHTHIEAPVHVEHAEGPSQVDAMGKDKRRAVVGGTYSPTRARIITTFATAIGIIVALVVGFILLAKQLDKAPASNPDQAPWSVPDAPQHLPKQLQ
jgi:ABC-type dipeptide/oligopeptide/nickel transport system permease subunit